PANGLARAGFSRPLPWDLGSPVLGQPLSITYRKCAACASCSVGAIPALDTGIETDAFTGVFEAGMMPGIAYYMSRWYRRSELAFRLALYIVMAPLAGAFGGLLASAILTLDHF